MFIEIIRTHIPKEEAKLSTVPRDKPKETDDPETSFKNKRQRALKTTWYSCPKTSYSFLGQATFDDLQIIIVTH